MTTLNYTLSNSLQNKSKYLLSFSGMMSDDVNDPPGGIKGLMRRQSDGTIGRMNSHTSGQVLRTHILRHIGLTGGQSHGGGGLRDATAADDAAGDCLPLGINLLKKSKSF